MRLRLGLSLIKMKQVSILRQSSGDGWMLNIGIVNLYIDHVFWS